jgi:hypothetical protein
MNIKPNAFRKYAQQTAQPFYPWAKLEPKHTYNTVVVWHLCGGVNFNTMDIKHNGIKPNIDNKPNGI